MPTYEYQCSTCRHRFDKFQSFSEEPVKACPECGNSVKKVISSSGIIFKGSGWYINDSKARNTATAPAVSKNDSAPANGAESSDKASSDGETKKETAQPVAAETKSDRQKNDGESKNNDGESKKKDTGSQKSDGEGKKKDSQPKKNESAA